MYCSRLRGDQFAESDQEKACDLYNLSVGVKRGVEHAWDAWSDD